METENTPIQSIIVQDFDYKDFNLLEKYSGKPLLIIIYNNQCLGCTGRAIPLAYKFQQEYAQLQVIGIHSIFNKQPVTEEDIKSIFTKNELPFPIYLDQEHKIYDQFHAEGTPQWLLITREGKLYRSIFGSQLGAQNRLMYALDALCS
ncbi:redoxin domain-containing protein [Marivirga salinae]|uniref:Redoxin domain-containing protein n=1 Tax=Marivirga salinarum TaxID=3059078 RepID=A0AA51N9H4_9BACT|nr:redoxin domain-containing protein [Marivirga sp. BDSF4-3]WMN11033.1 redoxin domain-containing protein [Marivirga sp. BDSF4-3]